MKTPEEIKKGLECCANSSFCDEECPYYEECNEGLESHATDALALIQQLEDCNAATCEIFAKREAQLLEKIEELKAQAPRWISVEERLPEPLQYVLVINRYDDDSFEPLVAYNRAGQWFTGSYMGGEVTHWAHLPEPPKEDAK